MSVGCAYLAPALCEATQPNLEVDEQPIAGIPGQPLHSLPSEKAEGAAMRRSRQRRFRRVRHAWIALLVIVQMLLTLAFATTAGAERIKPPVGRAPSAPVTTWTFGNLHTRSGPSTYQMLGRPNPARATSSRRKSKRINTASSTCISAATSSAAPILKNRAWRST